MTTPGLEIHRCYDELGVIRVFEYGSRRFLMFGEEAQQSCIDQLDPGTLVYEYTQAMMLALLYLPKPNLVTFLGIGAGSLLHSLNKYDPNISMAAVELRPKVVDIAQQWFTLDALPQVNVHIGDACDYISNTAIASTLITDKPTSSDIIFADIYNDAGMIESQLSQSFLADCYHTLSDHGILVLNLWDQGKGSHPLAIQRLQDQFENSCMTCLIEDGNLIAYAFKGGIPPLNVRRLQPLAKKLAKKLNIPVHKLLDRLKVV